MKTKKIFKYGSLVYGILLTFLMLLVFGSKITGKIIKEGLNYVIEIPRAFARWDDPTAFFITYIIGYVIIWWKPIWGSIIIISGSIFYVIISGIDGPLIFAAPTFLVGLLYLVYCFFAGKNNVNNVTRITDNNKRE